MLLLDYNRHAIPLDRLTCSPAEIAGGFQDGWAGGCRIEPEEVRLPDA